MRSVVVTGSSTGIGRGIAKVLTTQGIRVFGSVRRASDAERLSAELGSLFVPLIFDVTDRAGVARAAEQVSDALGGRTLFGLVNNAGVAYPGPLLHLAVDDFRHQLEVNLTGQLIVTQAFAPLVGADRARAGDPGRIVMMSSVGGRTGSPFVGAYNTSKFGLEGFSEALRRELILFGIDVIVMAPGAVATPIWDKVDALDLAPLADTEYAQALAMAKQFSVETGRRGFPPEKIGRAVLTALTAARPRTRYTVAPDRLQRLVGSALPKRVVDRLIARRLGLSSPRKRRP